MNDDPIRSKFSAMDRQHIERFCAQNEPEGLHLDFKCAPAKPEEIKKTAARLLSAFSNAEGGIIVWGIDARRKDGKHSVELSGVHESHRFLTNLIDWTPDLLSPSLATVTHRVIECNERVCVATFVPSIDAGPHMAKAGINQYFRRSGEDSRLMEHFEIAEMFGRRPSPTITIDYDIRINADSASARECVGYIIVGLKNIGRGIAKYPSLWLRFRPHSHYRCHDVGLARRDRSGLPMLPTASPGDGWTRFAGGINDVIHPGLALSVYQYRFDLLAHDTTNDAFAVEYLLACEGCPTQSGMLEVPREELRNRARQIVTGAAS